MRESATTLASDLEAAGVEPGDNVVLVAAVLNRVDRREAGLLQAAEGRQIVIIAGEMMWDGRQVGVAEYMIGAASLTDAQAVGFALAETGGGGWRRGRAMGSLCRVAAWACAPICGVPLPPDESIIPSFTPSPPRPVPSRSPSPNLP